MAVAFATNRFQAVVQQRWAEHVIALEIVSGADCVVSGPFFELDPFAMILGIKFGREI